MKLNRSFRFLVALSALFSVTAMVSAKLAAQTNPVVSIPAISNAGTSSIDPSVDLNGDADDDGGEQVTTSASGPYAYSMGEYKFPAEYDLNVFADAKTELWARVYWPSDLDRAAKNGPLPILFFMHGNHSTCGYDSKPRHDSGCLYTYEGRCEAGQVVVPNHQGFNYLGKHFASLGYIAVSINANRGITCNSGDDKDSGLILARGRLILKHLELWSRWTKLGGETSSANFKPSMFKGRVDLQNIGLMGHSRGGEGVRAAYNLLNDLGSPWALRLGKVAIKGIFEIGAVDGQSIRKLDADNTAWNGLIPMCDGDVTAMEGRYPFERMIVKAREMRRTPKSLYLVWGANHNYFNTQWLENDSGGCMDHDAIYGDGTRSVAQQKVAIAAMSDFFRAHVGRTADPELCKHFDPRYTMPASVTAITRIDRDHIYTPDSRIAARLDDFDQAEGKSSNKVTNESSGVRVTNEQGEDVTHYSHVMWDSPNGFLQLNWTNTGAGLSLANFHSLDFRVSRGPTHIGQKSPTDFSIQLVDANNQPSQKVSVSRFAQVLGPITENLVFQTVRIPLSEFAGVNQASVRGVRFTFDGAPNGSLFFANVRFSIEKTPANATPLWPVLTGESLLPLNLAAHSNGADSSLSFKRPFTQPPQPEEGSASLVTVKVRSRSRQLSSGRVVDLGIRARDRFPVTDALPVLVLGGRRFTSSRYPKDGRIDTLVFTVPEKDVRALPERGPMIVQYGKDTPRKLWRLPDYSKSDLIK